MVQADMTALERRWDRLLDAHPETGPWLADQQQARGLTEDGHPLCQVARPVFLTEDDLAQQAVVVGHLVRALRRARDHVVARRAEMPYLGRYRDWIDQLLRFEVADVDHGEVIRLDTFAHDGLHFVEANCDIPGGTGHVDGLAELFQALPFWPTFAREVEGRIIPLQPRLLDTLVASWRDWGGDDAARARCRSPSLSAEDRVLDARPVEGVGMHAGRWLLGLAAAGLVVAACSSGGDDVDTAATVDASEYVDEAEDFPTPPDDITFPDVRPDGPVGSYGFSNYVWTQVGDEAVPILIEGPRGEQTRCQDVDLPCSYTELSALHESGDPIPDELDMSGAELAELVGQLDTTHAVVAGFETIDEACAAGYNPSSSQNANMGIHMVNSAHTVDGVFDPAKPEMILFAKEGGETLRQSEIGECVEGRWEGQEGFEPVGAVFTTPLTAEHPDGFAGPIDNWHVHYNTCAGADDEATGGRLLGDPGPCEEQGGTFMEVIPVWMMHAYVMPEFDSETGVFAMYNNGIWPLTTDDDLYDKWTQQSPEGVQVAPINNFEFGEVEVAVGEDVVFSNSDVVPHTVTGTDGGFDSGVFGAGQTYARSFDAPGEYAIYCVLHPQMTGTVSVTE